MFEPNAIYRWPVAGTLMNHEAPSFFFFLIGVEDLKASLIEVTVQINGEEREKGR